MAEYFKFLPASSAEAAVLGDLPKIPVTILSAANSTPAQLAERDAIARQSPRGKHVVVPKSGHWIHLDQPEVVVKAIRGIVESVRSVTG
jgi:pimeloyl-ACP methyl ester carboxylesterase